MGLLTTLKQNDVFRDEKSLAFDGTNDYVDCGTNFESTLLNSDFSFSIWVKFVDGRPPSTDLYMFGTKDGNDNFWFRIETDGDVAFYYKEGTTQSNLVASGYLADGASNWIHFVGTLSDSAQKIYANGVVIASGTASLDTSGFAQDTNRNLVIGARNNAGTVGNYLPCNISEVAFYTTVLTINQVKTIYNGREPYNHKEGVASGNLQAWYRMGDGSLDDYAILTDETNATKSSDLSPNATFDTNTTGWSSYSSGDANTLSRDTTIKRTGSGSLKVVFGASNGGWAVQNSSNVVGVSANKLLVIEGYVYIPSGSYNGGHPFFTDGSSFVGASIEGVTYASSSITDQWQFMRTVSTLTSDTSGRFYVYTTGTDPSENDIIYLDDIKIYQINGNAGGMINMSATDIEGDTP